MTTINHRAQLSPRLSVRSRHGGRTRRAAATARLRSPFVRGSEDLPPPAAPGLALLEDQLDQGLDPILHGRFPFGEGSGHVGIESTGLG